MFFGGKSIAGIVLISIVSYYLYSNHMSRLYRARNLISQAGSLVKKQALVVGGTNGIGAGTAIRLAANGASVTIIGRSKETAEEVISEMKKVGNAQLNFDFVACDASLISESIKCAREWSKLHDRLDFLVMTQGKGSFAGRRPTGEGIEMKMALHYYSRMAFVTTLLPLLEKTSNSGNDVRVLTVLSAGVHSAYDKYREDPLLEENFSLMNAANAAGFFLDLGIDSLAQSTKAPISFIHNNPGAVATNWGSDFVAPLRWLSSIAVTLFAKTKEESGDFMLRSLVGPMENNFSTKQPGKFYLGDQYGDPTSQKTSLHSEEARTFVWKHTLDLLNKYTPLES